MGTESLNPSPSTGESVSALNCRAVRRDAGAFAVVCADMETRDGTGWLRTRLFGPFFSDGHWRSPTLNPIAAFENGWRPRKTAACECLIRSDGSACEESVLLSPIERQIDFR